MRSRRALPHSPPYQDCRRSPCRQSTLRSHRGSSATCPTKGRAARDSDIIPPMGATTGDDHPWAPQGQHDMARGESLAVAACAWRVVDGVRIDREARTPLNPASASGYGMSVERGGAGGHASIGIGRGASGGGGDGGSGKAGGAGVPTPYDTTSPRQNQNVDPTRECTTVTCVRSLANAHLATDTTNGPTPGLAGRVVPPHANARSPIERPRYTSKEPSSAW
jgi:hypothetical protein